MTQAEVEKTLINSCRKYANRATYFHVIESTIHVITLSLNGSN